MFIVKSPFVFRYVANISKIRRPRFHLWIRDMAVYIESYSQIFWTIVSSKLEEALWNDV